MDVARIIAEMEQARLDFHELVDTARVAELRRPSNGTRWTNDQLLFHMLLGYLVVRALLWLVRGFGRLPDAASRYFAAALNAGTGSFHVVNYLGSLGGARVLGHAGMKRVMDHVVRALQTSLRQQAEATLLRGMHFPVGWDPYFRDYMTLKDVYHYATQHYDHHRAQLTLDRVVGNSPHGRGGEVGPNA